MADYVIALSLVSAGVPESPSTSGSWNGSADTSWYSSSQTSFSISTAEQLAGLAKLVNDEEDSLQFRGKTITLTSDIDISGKEWIPIGIFDGENYGQYFNGTFDGGGHTITGLTIKNGKEAVGLFGDVAYNAVIKNINLTGVSVNGTYYVGGLIGWNSGGEVRNCKVIGTVDGSSDNVGGLVGWNAGGVILSSSAEGTVTGKKDVGGLVGDNWGEIEDCVASASVVAKNANAGGLVGSNKMFEVFDNGILAYPGIISGSYADGKVSSNSVAGGLVGENETGTIITNNSFSRSGTGQEYGIGNDIRSGGPSNNGATPR
jgi:hypothetical protein